jgi:hypothetical protein
MSGIGIKRRAVKFNTHTVYISVNLINNWECSSYGHISVTISNITYALLIYLIAIVGN